MTPFELFYLSVEPFLPPLHRDVRKRLVCAARDSDGHPELLDVGGRKSHYTIGVPASVTITDILRQSDIQESLHLGINDDIIRQAIRRRSNVKQVVYDDLTRTRLDSASFDIAVAVEVIEHVREDEAFVTNLARVLRPGGVAILTTPNGDANPIPHNPDHQRHYSRQQLIALLARHFSRVDVIYAVKGSRFRTWGLRSWSPAAPLRTIRSMLGNLLNSIESAQDGISTDPVNTRHLFATVSH